MSRRGSSESPRPGHAWAGRLHGPRAARRSRLRRCWPTQATSGSQGPSFSGSGADPTSSKPESKVWFNDGFWWASMYNSSASAFTIHRLSGTTWTNTGVVIDDRETTHQDALWDQAAGKLYVASHVLQHVAGVGQSRPALPLQLQRGLRHLRTRRRLPADHQQLQLRDPRHRQGLDRPAVGDVDSGQLRPRQPDDEWRSDLGLRVHPVGDWHRRSAATTSRRSSPSGATRSACCGATRTAALTYVPLLASTRTAPATRPGARASPSSPATTTPTITST